MEPTEVPVEMEEWWCPQAEDWVSCPGPCPDGREHGPVRRRTEMGLRFETYADFHAFMQREHPNWNLPDLNVG